MTELEKAIQSGNRDQINTAIDAALQSRGSVQLSQTPALPAELEQAIKVGDRHHINAVLDKLLGRAGLP